MNSCCDFNNDETPEFYIANETRARKHHQCCECGRDIPPGVIYIRKTGKWDGAISTYKTCDSCEGLIDALRNSGYCFGLTELREAYYEYLSNNVKGDYPANHLIPTA